MGVFASAAAVLLLAGAPAPADPSPCKGPAAHAGAVVEGTIIHVLDARRLCVARSPSPETWTELELAPETPWPALSAGGELSKAALMSVAFAKSASCKVIAAADGRPVAQCRVEGAPLETLMARPGTLERAALWLPKRPADPPVLASAQ